MENTHTRPSLARRDDGHGQRRYWSPFNITIWSSVGLAYLSGQMIAAVLVLTLSRHENPQTPLFAWVVGYATRCVVCLLLLYWRYHHRHHDSSQNSETDQQRSCIIISFTPPSDEEPAQPQNPPSLRVLNPRLIAVVDYFKMALEFFFVVWVGVGIMWIIGGNASAADAPNLYSLSTVFLTLSCLEFSMPFLLCAMIRCCLPCILSVLGIQGGVNQVIRRASEEYINALPKHKFQLRSDVEEGGVVAAGTEEERAISAEDAVCCICLQSYTENDELRELPCSHLFHPDCVDQWLKINATCPFCKCCPNYYGRGSRSLHIQI